MKLEKLNSYLPSVEMCLILMIVGMLCNTLVIARNDGRMPVYTKDYNLSTKEHFTFTKKSEVNDFFCTDRFKLLGNIMSIGDIIIYLAAILIIIRYSLYIILVFKQRKRKK